MNSRWVAACIITKVLQDGESLTSALDSALKTVDSTQDRAFVQAVCYGVCRYYHRLDFILNHLLDKPLKAVEVKALALIGLYQLRHMRVKTHAAVSETVQAARQTPWARGLINALLRSYLRRQEELENLADRTKASALSHPDWIIQWLERDWPGQAEAILHENNQQPPMVLRVNVKLTSREHYLQILAELNIQAKPVAFCPAGIILDKPAAIDALPNFAEGHASVQDSAAQLAAYLLEVNPGQRVLDVCAAPGGKTAHILELQPELAELVAVDIDANRMRRVGDNFGRLNLQATLTVADATKPGSWWDGRLFDRILLDAPCSATGVIRRHPDIKLLRRPDDIATLTTLQSHILKAIWPLLAPGGLLLYATCSVLKQENEQQIQAFLSEYDNSVELPIQAEWGNPRSCGRQVMTGESSMDGFYYARIVKR